MDSGEKIWVVDMIEKHNLTIEAPTDRYPDWWVTNDQMPAAVKATDLLDAVRKATDLLEGR